MCMSNARGTQFPSKTGLNGDQWPPVRYLFPGSGYLQKHFHRLCYFYSKTELASSVYKRKPPFGKADQALKPPEELWMGNAALHEMYMLNI